MRFVPHHILLPMNKKGEAGASPLRLLILSESAAHAHPCARGIPYILYILVNIVPGVIDIELAGRRDQTLVLDDVLDLSGLVVQHDDGGFLFLAAPHGEPHLGAVSA